MSLRTLKTLTIVIPPLIIGGFEYIRHDFLLSELSMESGNLYITLLTLLLSYVFASWMFHSIGRTNERLAAEEAKRAVYEERERLAQELHDNIAQILFFLNVQLKKGQLQEARSAVAEIDHHLRQAIFNLRTSPEDAADFTARLSTWLEEWSGITGIAVEQSIRVPEVISPASEVQLFAIIREAFTNIRKHSEADHAVIEWGQAEEEGTWILRIQDNGIGLGCRSKETAGGAAAAQGSSSSNRYGISQMRKHAEALGAKLTVRTVEHGGAEVCVTGKLQGRNGR